MRSTSAGISVGIHLAAVLLMSLVGARVAAERYNKPVRIVIPLYDPPHVTRSPGGGGGSLDRLPASKGMLPPRRVARVFVPPSIVREEPKLAVTAALIDAPDITFKAENYGDPLGKSGILSGGPGRGGGFGDQCCGGAGHTRGPGVGPGEGGARVGEVVKPRYSTPPKLVYKIEPEYPDEARKARYQGTVILNVEVDTDGRPNRVRVLEGLGLGMDERAVDAVTHWRFTPARFGGKPVAAPVIVEVSFRLL